MKVTRTWKIIFYVIFMEALLTWGFFTFRGLWTAVKTANARYTNARIYVHTHAPSSR